MWCIVTELYLWLCGHNRIWRAESYVCLLESETRTMIAHESELEVCWSNCALENRISTVVEIKFAIFFVWKYHALHHLILFSCCLLDWWGCKHILSLFRSLHQSQCSGYDKGPVYVSVREGLACPILSLDIPLGASFKASYLRPLAFEVVSISLKLLLPDWTSWYCIHFHCHDKILI